MLLSFVLFSCAPRSVNDSHIQTPIVQTVKEDTPVSAPPPVEPPPPKNVELATDLWDIDPRLKPYEDRLLLEVEPGSYLFLRRELANQSL